MNNIWELNLEACTDINILWAIYKNASDMMPCERIPRADGVSLMHLKSILEPYTFAKRIQWIIHKLNKELDPMLARAFPSAPLHPGRFELRINRDDGAFAMHIFFSPYAAKKFFEVMIDNRTWSWVDRTTIRCADLIITSKKLETLILHEYTTEEAAWVLPLPYDYYARDIGNYESYTGEKYVRNTKTGAPGITPASAGKQRKTGRPVTSEPAEPTSKRSSRQDRASKRTAERASSTSSQSKVAGKYPYGIPQLVAATKLDASKVRAILRKKLGTKPAEGWVWDEAGYNQVLKILR